MQMILQWRAHILTIKHKHNKLILIDSVALIPIPCIGDFTMAVGDLILNHVCLLE